MFKPIYVVVISMLFVLASVVACGGAADEQQLSVGEDELVKYTGIDGSDQTCEECCCATDNLGNCIVTDVAGTYLAMCGTCTENAFGGVTYTPRPVVVRPRAR